MSDGNLKAGARTVNRLASYRKLAGIEGGLESLDSQETSGRLASMRRRVRSSPFGEALCQSKTLLHFLSRTPNFFLP